ncbi:MAG TPA: HIT family protein [Ktedonosporobacter sp.]|nr:HIT family protein [Ktedonosporobacter sp.]
METCPFCNTDKDPPFTVGGILYEDELVYAHHYGQGKEAIYLGHLLLMTKRHALGLADLTEAEGRAIGLSIARLSKALKACTGAEKVYVEAYYEVNPHLHLHLMARYPATPQEYWRGNISAWPEAPKGGPEEITDLCNRLHAYLEQSVLDSVP